MSNSASAIADPSLPLNEIMRRLGIDVGLSSELFMSFMTQAAYACILCRNAEACREWCGHRVLADGYPDFCPNAELFDYLPRTKVPQPDPVSRPASPRRGPTLSCVSAARD
jgi:hypothetical protein